MHTSWILQSKLLAPSRPAGWLERDLLQNRPLPPVTLLLAGPGYGKTLGLLALSSSAAAPEPILLWYSLDAYDADPATFFHYLVAGMQAHIPRFGEELKALLGAEKLEPRLLWQCFWQSVASYNLPSLHVVLDDCHHLVDARPELVQALAYFFDKLPPGVRLLLSSRKRLGLPLSRHQAKGHLLMLDQAQLRFGPEEEQRFLQARAPEGVVPKSWQERATGLDGWPLALDWLAGGAELVAGEVEGLADYVSEELYAAQSEERQAFMLRAALLQELTVEACREVFEALQALDHLEALEAEHLVLRLGAEVYRFPTYLRDFLLAEARRRLPADAVAGYHRLAARWYGERGMDEQALPHLLASGDWSGAARYAGTCFRSMQFTGRQAQIERWLAAFPPAAAEQEPVVQLWWGHLHARGGRLVEAQSAYAAARKLFGMQEDAAGEFKVLVRQLTIAVRQQDGRQAGRLMLEAQARQQDGLDEDRVDLHLARALAADQRGDLGLMDECNQAVLSVPIAQNVEIAASHCIALMNLFTLGLHRGELAQAHRHIAQLIEVAEAWKLYPYHLYASFLQAYMWACEGHMDRADAFFKALPPFWEDALDWQDQAGALHALGYYHVFKGNWTEAEAALERSLAIYKKAGFDEGCKVPLEPMLWMAIQRKQYARVERLVEAEALQARSIYDLGLLLPYARALHLNGRFEAALEVLLQILPEFERLGAQLQLARARLFEAAVRLRLGQTEAAAAAFAGAIALSEAQGYRFLLEQDQLLWEELQGLLREPGPQAAAQAVEPKSGQLAVQALGGLEVRLDGVLVDQWSRRGAKLVFAALLLHTKGLTLAELADALGGDELTFKTLKVYLFALRRTLEPHLGKGEASRYVTLEGDRYRLNREAIAFLDLDAFEAALSHSASARSIDAVASAAGIEEALSHYRGHLLDMSGFEPYFELERARYREMAVEAIGWLASFHEGRGDFSSMEACLRRGLELSPCEESLYIRLMRHYQEHGWPERVRQVYWDCRKALKVHFDISPSDTFETAYQAITAESQATLRVPGARA